MSKIGMCPKCQRWLTDEEPFCPVHGLRHEDSHPTAPQAVVQGPPSAPPPSSSSLPSPILQASGIPPRPHSPALTGLAVGLVMLFGLWVLFNCLQMKGVIPEPSATSHRDQDPDQDAKLLARSMEWRSWEGKGVVWHCNHCLFPVPAGADICGHCGQKISWRKVVYGH